MRGQHDIRVKCGSLQLLKQVAHLRGLDRDTPAPFRRYVARHGFNKFMDIVFGSNQSSQGSYNLAQRVAFWRRRTSLALQRTLTRVVIDNWNPVIAPDGDNSAYRCIELLQVFDVDVLRSIVQGASGGSAGDTGAAFAAAQLMRALRIALGNNVRDMLPQLLKKRLADPLETGKLVAPKSGERCSCSKSTKDHDGFDHDAAAMRRPGARAASTQPVLAAAGNGATQQSAAVPLLTASAAAAEAGSSSAPPGPVAVARDGSPGAAAVNGDALAALMADALARRAERAAAAAQHMEEEARGGSRSDTAALPVSAEQAGAAAAAAAESAQQEARSGSDAAALTAEQAVAAAAAAAEDQDPAQGTPEGQGSARETCKAYTPSA
ncbi:hypothetical protein JKP88DRAFT_277416 [Tribonema minus]|uniref:Uncharacterized protein n=1 Tax=Tribonema minus TaxID=303371 RepID=A0A835YZP0_9STRA|nr:hypothetical protein JKP88DRAFT_277416 [Tribonema minus]